MLEASAADRLLSCYHDSMTISKHTKILSVRMPEAELRRVKSLAASRGVSVQTAVHQALEAWTSDAPQETGDTLTALQGTLADVDVIRLLHEDKQAELTKDRR